MHSHPPSRQPDGVANRYRQPIGKAEYFEQIERMFFLGELNTFAIVGLPGVGKTYAANMANLLYGSAWERRVGYPDAVASACESKPAYDLNVIRAGKLSRKHTSTRDAIGHWGCWWNRDFSAIVEVEKLSPSEQQYHRIVLEKMMYLDDCNSPNLIYLIEDLSALDSSLQELFEFRSLNLRFPTQGEALKSLEDAFAHYKLPPPEVDLAVAFLELVRYRPRSIAELPMLVLREGQPELTAATLEKYFGSLHQRNRLAVAAVPWAREE